MQTMKKLKKIFLLLALGSLFLPLLNSCHKYPEDPFISLRRPWKRLEGTWKFTSYKINGVEHSHDFDSMLASKTLTDCSITFHPFYNLKGWYSLQDNNGNSIHYIDANLGNYVFDDDRKWRNISIAGDTSLFYRTLWKGQQAGFLATASKWKIMELYSKHLHINTNNIDIYFTKK